MKRRKVRWVEVPDDFFDRPLPLALMPPKGPPRPPARQHIEMAERAIGRKLPPGAHVHHVDGNHLNNAPGNLVVCPSGGYHMLLHARTRALDACGNPNWRPCKMCGAYGPPKPKGRRRYRT